MLRIGVTGLMASGKSTVARRFEARGAIRIDADALGWDTLREPSIRSRIAETFGPGVLGSDGHVDRALLARIVFGDPAQMARLDAIVQPSLRARVVERMNEAARSGAEVAVLDAALIGAWKLEPELDGIVLVTAPEEARAARLRASRGMSEAEARERIRGQRLPEPEEPGRPGTTGGERRLWRIVNDGGADALLRLADRTWTEIQALRERSERP